MKLFVVYFSPVSYYFITFMSKYSSLHPVLNIFNQYSSLNARGQVCHPNITETLLWLYSPLDLSQFFTSLILFTVCRTPWTGDQPVARPIPTHRTTNTQNKRTQTSMSRVEFEPTFPVFQWAKAVITETVLFISEGST
jgi:hypothetical protein